MPALNSGAVLAALRTHAMTLGRFEQVFGHEPKSKPTASGITAAYWAQRITAVARSSGLDATSARLLVNARLYTNMLADPQDAIDPRLTDACDELMAAYCGHFTLGGLVSSVDLLGIHGQQLDAVAGYIPQDGALFRCYTLTLPLIIEDAWTQEA